MNNINCINTKSNALNANYRLLISYKNHPQSRPLTYKNHLQSRALTYKNHLQSRPLTYHPQSRPLIYKNHLQARQLIYKNLSKLRKNQKPPQRNWRTWLLMAGRGFGKTYAGAQTIADWIISKKFKRICLISKTANDVNAIMVNGPSGILSILREHGIDYKYTKKYNLIEIDEDIKINLFSADAPESLRGHEFDCAWIDEFAKFDNGGYILDQLEFCLRISEDAKIIITTTPRPKKFIKDLVVRDDVIVSHGNTYDNLDNLPKSFIKNIRRRYENTQVGQQEIYGKIIDENQFVKPEMIQHIGYDFRYIKTDDTRDDILDARDDILSDNTDRASYQSSNNNSSKNPNKPVNSNSKHSNIIKTDPPSPSNESNNTSEEVSNIQCSTQEKHACDDDPSLISPSNESNNTSEEVSNIQCSTQEKHACDDDPSLNYKSTHRLCIAASKNISSEISTNKNTHRLCIAASKNISSEISTNKNITKTSAVIEQNYKSLKTHPPNTSKDSSQNISNLPPGHDISKIVIGVDPAVTSNENSDETGIIVVGADAKYENYYVIDDLSGRYNPNDWAKMVINAYKKYSANSIVAEINNGGDIVESMLKVYDKNIVYKGVRASNGKITRAEPVIALYEQRRVFHLKKFDELEEQVLNLKGYTESPDRFDAMVWGITELMNMYYKSDDDKLPYGGDKKIKLWISDF